MHQILLDSILKDRKIKLNIPTFISLASLYGMISEPYSSNVLIKRDFYAKKPKGNNTGEF